MAHRGDRGHHQSNVGVVARPAARLDEVRPFGARIVHQVVDLQAARLRLGAFLFGRGQPFFGSLRRLDGRVVLKSENPAYPPMVFSEGVEILGVVVALMRRVS